MSEAGWRKRVVTHLPDRHGCQSCAAATRNDTPPLSSTRAAEVPNIGRDNGFRADANTDDTFTFRCAYVRPWELYFAMAVDVKGRDPNAAKRLADWPGAIGLCHFAATSDT